MPPACMHTSVDAVQAYAALIQAGYVNCIFLQPCTCVWLLLWCRRSQLRTRTSRSSTSFRRSAHGLLQQLLQRQSDSDGTSSCC
jgi:hypothetical protein